MDSRIRAVVMAAARQALILHRGGVERDEAVRIASSAALRVLERDPSDAGLGMPDLAPGFPLLALSGILSGVGWAVHLLKG